MIKMINQRTGEYESFNEANAKDYLPQIPAALGLYDVHIAQGDSSLLALEKVLLACVGQA